MQSQVQHARTHIKFFALFQLSHLSPRLPLQHNVTLREGALSLVTPHCSLIQDVHRSNSALRVLAAL